ncbi:NUDIX hydrolase [Tessaracoccus sp. OH4464_COT-324]|nr:NUDIX hydrolase [Tessaracoccus sp. OH4464_COT-324]
MGGERPKRGWARFGHMAIAVVLRVCGQNGLCVFAFRDSAVEGEWRLPSGLLEQGETLEMAVRRNLSYRMDVDSLAHLEQLQTSGMLDVGVGERIFATSYLGVAPWAAREEQLRSGGAWLSVNHLPKMAGDHAELVQSAADTLRAKISRTELGHALAPSEFTIAQLRDAYAAVLGYEVSSTNLQRVLQRRGQLETTGAIARPGAEGGRPARLYRFVSQAAMAGELSGALLSAS